MAKATVDLDTRECICRACGHRQPEPLPNPCPNCGTRFHVVEYRRGDIRKMSELTTEQISNVEFIDTRTHLMVLLAGLWSHQARMLKLGGYAPEYVEKKKQEFYAEKLSKFEQSRRGGAS